MKQDMMSFVRKRGRVATVLGRLGTDEALLSAEIGRLPPTRANLREISRLLEQRELINEAAADIATSVAGDEPFIEEFGDRKLGDVSRYYKRSLDLDDDPMIVETLTGYATVWFDPANPDNTQHRLDRGALTRVYERIDQHAFDRSLQEGDEVLALFNHLEDFPLARLSAGTLKLWVDDVGLGFRFQPSDSYFSRDLVANIRSRVICKASIGFDCVRVEWTREKNGDRIRTVKEGRLKDIAPVTFPAIKGTSCMVDSQQQRSGFASPPSASSHRPPTLESMLARQRKAEYDLSISRLDPENRRFITELRTRERREGRIRRSA